MDKWIEITPRRFIRIGTSFIVFCVNVWIERMYDLHDSLDKWNGDNQKGVERIILVLEDLVSVNGLWIKCGKVVDNL